MDTTPHTTPAPPPPPGPRRFLRSSSDRVVGGVCGGLGRYFNVDATLVRIGFVALALVGGAGFVVYVAALLLVPTDGEEPAPQSARDRAVSAGVVALLALGTLVLGGVGLWIGWALVPLWLLLLAGLAVWWLAAGRQPAGSPREVLVRALQGVGMLVACTGLAVGSFFASGLGGGVVVAAIVIVAGAALVAAAFVGGARWLVLPALAIAMPLAFVSAAGIDLDGGFGQRTERPAAVAELRDGYRLGMGELVLDLRDVELPAGDRELSVDIGAGHALVLVRDDVCVASRASVGMGGVEVFDRDGGGIDVDFSDVRRAPQGTPRLVVDGNVGLGLFEVRHSDDDGVGPRWRHRDGGATERNAACVGG